MHSDSPHKAAAKMLSDLPAVSCLKDMHSTSVANVALGFPEGAVKMEHEGTGFVISRNSDFSITAHGRIKIARGAGGQNASQGVRRKGR